MAGRGSRVRYCDSSAKVKKARQEQERGGRGGTHRFLGSRIILYGCTDDPQRLHFHVVLRRGEQALQRLPHAELFEILRTDANFSHWRPGPVVEGVSKSDKADERQQHTCVTIRIVDVLDELGTSSHEKKKQGNRREALPFRDRPAPSDAHRRRGTHPAPLRGPPSSAPSRACPGSRR